MLVFTEDGCFYSTVKDFDGDFLWVRSQDKRSIEQFIKFLKAIHPDRTYTLMRRPEWDYEFRVRAERDEWGAYLEATAQAIEANKIKPTIAAAVGHDHAYAKAVSELFYRLSETRPSGTVPAWLRR